MSPVNNTSLTLVHLILWKDVEYVIEKCPTLIAQPRLPRLTSHLRIHHEFAFAGTRVDD